MNLKTSRRIAAALTTAALAITAAPAIAAVEEPIFVTEQNYFTCAGTTKVGQVNTVADGALPSWNTVKPTASVQSGAGCGAYDVGPLNGTSQATIYDASFEGTFTGNLRDIAMEVHFTNPGAVAFAEADFNIRIAIDGTEYDLGDQFIEAVPAQVSATGATYSSKFALNDIDLIDNFKGAGTVTHTYTITVTGHFVDTQTATAIVWGTTEVPGGLTFNADTKGLPSVKVR